MAGARGVLPIAATCAAAGIIVAVVSLTGLGLELSSLIVDAAGGSLALTAVFSAVAVLIVGLAVPVTASFIIAAVIIAPALVALGVEDYAAYMFIFYYAVLSEVSPPTALSAFAAAAITGGDGFRTMMLLIRYTAPAFLVPFAFVLTENGQGLLLQGGLETIAARGRRLRGGGARRSASRSAAGCAGPCPAAAAAAGRRRLGDPALPRAAVDRRRPRRARAWRWRCSSSCRRAAPAVPRPEAEHVRSAAATLGRVARTPLAQTSVRDALDSALIALTAAGCDTPRLDAELLLADAMGVDRAVIVSDPGRGLTPEQARRFQTYAMRRAQREPVAYILGTKGFRTIDLLVDPRVLIPRPETEHLVEAALDAAARARAWPTSARARAPSRSR